MKNAGVAIIVALGLWAWSRRAKAAPPGPPPSYTTSQVKQEINAQYNLAIQGGGQPSIDAWAVWAFNLISRYRNEGKITQAQLVELNTYVTTERAKATPPPGSTFPGQPPEEWPAPPTPPVITPAPPVTNTGYLKWMTFPPGITLDIGWQNVAGVTVTFDRMFITAVPSSYGVGMKPDGSLIWWTGAAVIPYTGLSVIDGHPYSLYYQQTLPISGPTSFPPGPA